MTNVNITENKYKVTVSEGVTTVVTAKAPGVQGADAVLQAGDRGDFTVSVAGNGAQTAVINTGAITSDKILDGTIVSGDIADGTIVNDDINASAAIQGSKITPSFGSQNVTTGGNFSCGGGQFTFSNDAGGKIRFLDTNNNPDFNISSSQGTFQIDQSSSDPIIKINSDKHVDINYNLDVTADISLIDESPAIFFTDTNNDSDFSLVLNTGIFRIRDVTNSNADRFTIDSSGIVNVAEQLELGGNIKITKGNPIIQFNDDDDNPDYYIGNVNGVFRIRDTTNNANRILINTDGHIDLKTNVDCEAGLDVTGNISVTGTVGGRDLATDGTKLDGIETGATADQTAAEIKTLLNSNGIVNAQVDASAAIAGTKVSPSFGSQDITTNGNITAFGGTLKVSGTTPRVVFTDTDDDSDYRIILNNGFFQIQDTTNGNADRFKISSDGTIEIAQNLDVGAGIDVTGDINGTGDLSLTADTPKIRLIDNNADDDFQISNFSGNFIIKDITNSVDRFTIESDGTTTVANNLNVGAGIDVTGVITGTSHIDLPDDATLKLGDNDEFQIFHRGNDSVSLINEQGGGYLSFGSNGSRIEMYDIANARTMAEFNTGGSCVFKHAADIRLATSSTGVDITGFVTATAINVCHLKSDTTASVTSTAAVINFNQESTTDTNKFSHSGGEITVLTTGWYAVKANVTYQSAATSRRNTIKTEIQKNGTSITSAEKYTFIQSDIKPIATAHVNSDGTVIKQNGGFSSITRTASGRYTLNFTNAMADDDYQVFGQIIEGGNRDDIKIHIRDGQQTTTDFDLEIYEGDNGTTADVRIDKDFYIQVLDTNTAWGRYGQASIDTFVYLTANDIIRIRTQQIDEQGTTTILGASSEFFVKAVV